MSAKPSSDPSAPSAKRSVGIAPLVSGLLLVGWTASDAASGDVWAVSGLVGGCAAVLVGGGILLGRGEFDPEAGDGDSPHATSLTALAALAVASFAVGVGLYVV